MERRTNLNILGGGSIDRGTVDRGTVDSVTVDSVAVDSVTVDSAGTGVCGHNVIGHGRAKSNCIREDLAASHLVFLLFLLRTSKL